MADNTAKIAELRAILEAGETQTTIAGTSTTLDLNQVRMELSRLMAEDDTQRSRRPRLSTVNLGKLM